jgi:hypothetical protein
MIRGLWVDTAFQGLGLDVTTQQGNISARTMAPHGVVLIVDGKRYEITANALAEIGRFFGAAALHCGEDIGGGGLDV